MGQNWDKMNSTEFQAVSKDWKDNLNNNYNFHHHKVLLKDMKRNRRFCMNKGQRQDNLCNIDHCISKEMKKGKLQSKFCQSRNWELKLGKKLCSFCCKHRGLRKGRLHNSGYCKKMESHQGSCHGNNHRRRHKELQKDKLHNKQSHICREHQMGNRSHIVLHHIKSCHLHNSLCKVHHQCKCKELLKGSLQHISDDNCKGQMMDMLLCNILDKHRGQHWTICVAKIVIFSSIA